ncbi:MAG TPA: Fe-S cluster assembly protein SufD [Candidatus Cryosericum sp.]|nr:Fe-S cluster assembly protein SufD [Candidatus Cryosericum sp.]
MKAAKPASHEEIEPYLEAFARFRKDKANGDGWLASRREEAMARFAARGFPTTKEEAWRYTSLQPLVRSRFDLSPAPRPEALTPSLFEQLTFEPWDCTHLVFLNGRYAPNLSRIAKQPEGVVLTSLAQAIREHRDLVEAHLGGAADGRARPLTDLNTAFLSDGLFLHVPRGAVLQEPIHALFVSMSNGTPAMSHPRNLIVVGEGAQATVLESYAGIGKAPYFTNAVTEVAAAGHAVVDHYRLEREQDSAFHLSDIEARVERSASFSTQAVALGGRLVRQDVGVVLDGEGAECTLNGLYVLDGDQHVDNHTLIDHARPHGTSRELYKGVLDGRSRGIFDGTIVVRKDAQKSDARQVNRNLLLSDEALADSKPTLQIEADDVKCSHAATIGQLEEDALFYLRSRGLGAETARNLLVQAFVSDLLGRIRIEPVRAGLECLLFTRLPRHHAKEAS